MTEESLQVDVIKLSGIRKAAARQMMAAWEAPAFHLSVDIDMTVANEVKSTVEGATITDVILKAVATALGEHPGINAWYVGDFTVQRVRAANIGIAVASPGGLTVPVVHDVGSLTLAETATRRRDVVARAREGKLRRDDIADGTFTVSNLGMLGIAEFDAILNVPQVAILAVAATREQFVATQIGPQWRPIARFTLTCDHRAVDGAEGAAFLASLKKNLENATATA